MRVFTRKFSNAVARIAFSQDSKYVALALYGCADPIIFGLKYNEEIELKPSPINTRVIEDLVFVGRCADLALFLATEQGIVVRWRLVSTENRRLTYMTTDKHMRLASSDCDKVTRLASSNCANLMIGSYLLASVHSDYTIRIWNCITLKCVRWLHPQRKTVGMAFTNDARTLVSVETQGCTLFFWNVQRGDLSCSRKLTDNDSPCAIKDIYFLKCGSRIVCKLAENVVAYNMNLHRFTIWLRHPSIQEVTRDGRYGVFPTQTLLNNSTTFSPCGTYLVSANQFAMNLFQLVDLPHCCSVALTLFEVGVAPYIVLDIYEFLTRQHTVIESEDENKVVEMHFEPYRFALVCMTATQSTVFKFEEKMRCILGVHGLLNKTKKR
jgi:WD40 repeat protein